MSRRNNGSGEFSPKFARLRAIRFWNAGYAEHLISIAGIDPENDIPESDWNDIDWQKAPAGVSPPADCESIDFQEYWNAALKKVNQAMEMPFNSRNEEPHRNMLHGYERSLGHEFREFNRDLAEFYAEIISRHANRWAKWESEVNKALLGKIFDLLVIHAHLLFNQVPELRTLDAQRESRLALASFGSGIPLDWD